MIPEAGALVPHTTVSKSMLWACCRLHLYASLCSNASRWDVAARTRRSLSHLPRCVGFLLGTRRSLSHLPRCVGFLLECEPLFQFQKRSTIRNSHIVNKLDIK